MFSSYSATQLNFTQPEQSEKEEKRWVKYAKGCFFLIKILFLQIA
jgi:hypothetical protein